MIRAARKLLCTVAALSVAGCYTVPGEERPALTSFDVKVVGLYKTAGVPLDVVSVCKKKYDNGNVPTEVRGTPDCPFAIPRGTVEVAVEITALGEGRVPLTDFNGPVALRIVPGDVNPTYADRNATVTNGVGSHRMKVSHLYSGVQVWVEDAPSDPLYKDDGTINTDGRPEEPAARTYATGLSQVVHFEDPTLAKVQIPDGFDNRGSPFEGAFLTIGSPPESGRQLLQSCEDDPTNDGKPALLVVTGTDPTGFFVTDLTACRQPEVLKDETGSTQVRVPEPTGYMPGTFGSMFIYNYSFPEGLDEGDALWSVAGAVQEFTSTTQLTFPSWIVAERVRSLPEADWNKYLKFIEPKEISLRTCGLDNSADPFITDYLCGHNRRNLKMESLESGLVTVKNVKFANVFHKCDLDGNGEVPFFCEQPVNGEWTFDACGGPGSLSPIEEQEMRCNVECVTGTGQFTGTVCSEEATFVGFGQFIAELAGPGPTAAGLDESLPERTQSFPVTAVSTRAPRSWGAGIEVRLFCDAPVRVKFGGDMVVATAEDTLVAANTRHDHLLTGTETHLAVMTDGAVTAQCQVAQNPRTRINVVTKDAIPELKPNCDPNDADAAAAKQCQNLRGATFDVVGHLRHLQPGRPRWVILPRDRDDVCCYPGPGLECPAPIQPCN